MKFENEKEIENMLVSHFNKTGECRVTGKFYDHYAQQFSIPGYGLVDILGIDIEAELNYIGVFVDIFEIKQRDLKAKDVAQISRYYRGVYRYIASVYGFKLDSSGFYLNESRKRGLTVKLSGYLVGSGFSDNDQHHTGFLIDAIPWLRSYKYTVGFDGITFEPESGWYRKSETKRKIPKLILDVDGSVKNHIREARRER